MFGPRYFAPRYFAPRYYPAGGTGAAQAAGRSDGRIPPPPEKEVILDDDEVIWIIRTMMKWI